MKDLFTQIDKIITAIPVSEIMVKDIKTLNENDPAQKAVEMMAKYSISGVIICNAKNFPVGMVSEGDLLKKVFHLGKNPKKVLLKQVMSRKLMTIPSNMNIGETSAFMKKNKISKLPVMDSDKIIGYVTKSDLVEKLNEIYKQNRKLMLMAILIAVQFVVIALLLVAYINK